MSRTQACACGAQSSIVPHPHAPRRRPTCCLTAPPCHCRSTTSATAPAAVTKASSEPLYMQCAGKCRSVVSSGAHSLRTRHRATCGKRKAQPLKPDGGDCQVAGIPAVRMGYTSRCQLVPRVSALGSPSGSHPRVQQTSPRTSADVPSPGQAHTPCRPYVVESCGRMGVV